MKLLSLRSCVLAAVAAAGIAAQGEVKVVRVVPNGEAGENPDGASWETAYGDIKTAYESLGAEGGEVWIKKGLHILSNAVEMAANIGVYGGFAGTETSRTAADPKANMTLITGDWELNDQHRTKNQRGWRNEGCSPMWDYSTLTFNEPIPSYTYSATDNDNYFHTPWPDADFTGFSVSTKQADFDAKKVKDTLCAFRHAADAADFGVAHFEGLVFSGFKKNVIVVEGVADPTQPDANKVEIRNCRFLGCCNGLFGTSGSGYGPVRVINARVTVENSEFNRCFGGITWSAAQLVSDDLCCIVTNCHFHFLTETPVSLSCSGHETPKESPRFCVSGCAFDHNYRFTVGSCGVDAAANGKIDRCSFKDTFTTENEPTLVRISGSDDSPNGANVEVSNCSFVGNEARYASLGTSGFGLCIATRNGTFVGTPSGRAATVRNCYFAKNLIRVAKNPKASCVGVCYSAGSSTSGNAGKASWLIFFNCTAEDNRIEFVGSTANAASLAEFHWKGVFVNCVMRGFTFIDSSSAGGRSASVFDTNVHLINSVVQNDNPNFVLNSASFQKYYNSLCTKHQSGTDADGNPIYDDLSGLSFVKCVSEAGVPMLRVKSTSKYPARPVWDADGEVLVYDKEHNSQKPWRLFVADYARDTFGIKKENEVKSGYGVEKEDPSKLLVDANGKARRNKIGQGIYTSDFDTYGPLRHQSGLVIILK